MSTTTHGQKSIVKKKTLDELYYYQDKNKDLPLSVRAISVKVFKIFCPGKAFSFTYINVLPDGCKRRPSMQFIFITEYPLGKITFRESPENGSKRRPRDFPIWFSLQRQESYPTDILGTSSTDVLRTLRYDVLTKSQCNLLRTFPTTS